jgi:hypothetical protein
MSTLARIQPMPELTADQHNALRADIEAHGVIVPIVLDQHGRILDGNNRAKIANELGIHCPSEIRFVADDAEAHDLAVALNCARRHLTREQVRHVIAAEIIRRPDDSDRALARRIGCSPSTVGAVRNPAVSNLDTSTTMGRGDAQALTAQIRETITAARDGLSEITMMLLSNRVAPAEIVMALTMQKRRFEHGFDPETSTVAAAAMFDPILDYLLDPDSVEEWRPHWDHDTFEPLTDAEKNEVLDLLAGGAS